MEEEQEGRYRIKLDVFEGPFDLLLTLLEKNKIDIADIRISVIADQYIDILKESFDVETASAFLVMASTLLQLKSKRLLPKPVKEEEEITEEELIRRLLLYKRYKETAPQIGQLLEFWKGAYYKLPEALSFPKRAAPISLDQTEFMQCYREILLRGQEKKNDNSQKMERILKVERVSLWEKMQQVIRHVLQKTKARFSELFSFRKSSRAEVVTGFLAVLELDRRKQIRVEQRELFGDITLYQGDFPGKGAQTLPEEDSFYQEEALYAEWK